MSDRIIRIQELIKEELSQILLEEGIFPVGILGTIMAVKVSDTIEDASVWISILPKEKEGEALGILKERGREVQKILNKRLNLRFVPRLFWRIDHGQEYAEKIENLLDT